jgi:CRISPR/Cas system-associated exonuclease Cas4 (RecB family)
MTKLSHSYSAIKMYENCPQRYYFQRIAKAVVDQGSDATLYGERIHKALEDRLRDGTALPSESKHLEDVAISVESKAATMGASLHLEQELTLNASLQPTGWWDDDAWLRSKLDVLMLHGKSAVVIDWKTGKRRPDFDQLKLFAVQTMTHYPDVDKVRTMFVWTKETALDSKTFTRKELPDLWTGVLDKIRRIEKSVEHDKWPAIPSGLCRWCPAKHICDYAQV